MILFFFSHKLLTMHIESAFFGLWFFRCCELFNYLCIFFMSECVSLELVCMVHSKPLVNMDNVNLDLLSFC